MVLLKRLTYHQFGQRLDLSAFFRDLDEFIGADESHFRMVPARQGLYTGNIPG